MRVYQKQQPIQYYKPHCRKDGEIKAVGSKVPAFIWMILLFLTFAFADLFITYMSFNSYSYMFEAYMAELNIESFFITILLVVGFFEVGIFYLQVAIYNFIARWYLRGEIPCSTSELFKNLMPFFVIRNLIWGGLSLLMFLPGGMFVSVGMVGFEAIATMIIFLPAFNAIKKRYIKQGYGKEILQAFATPYIVFQVAFLIF